jgi:hypothetical protein
VVGWCGAGATDALFGQAIKWGNSKCGAQRVRCVHRECCSQTQQTHGAKPRHEVDVFFDWTPLSVVPPHTAAGLTRTVDVRWSEPKPLQWPPGHLHGVRRGVALHSREEKIGAGGQVRSLVMSAVYVRWSGPNPSPCNDHTTVSSARLSLEWRPEVQAQLGRCISIEQRARCGRLVHTNCSVQCNGDVNTKRLGHTRFLRAQGCATATHDTAQVHHAHGRVQWEHASIRGSPHTVHCTTGHMQCHAVNAVPMPCQAPKVPCECAPCMSVTFPPGNTVFARIASVLAATLAMATLVLSLGELVRCACEWVSLLRCTTKSNRLG